MDLDWQRRYRLDNVGQLDDVGQCIGRRIGHSSGGGAAIVLGGSSTISGAVDLVSAAPTVSHLTFSANRPVTITSTAAGGGQLTLENGSSLAAVVVSGSGQTIDGTVAVTLNSEAWITTLSSSDTLSIGGDISSGTAACGIILDGPGTLILSGSNRFGGGTTVNDGILEIAAADALPVGSSLTVGAGGTQLFDASAATWGKCGGPRTGAEYAPAADRRYGDSARCENQENGKGDVCTILVGWAELASPTK